MEEIFDALLSDIKPAQAQIEALAESITHRMRPARYIWERMRQTVHKYERMVDIGKEVVLYLLPLGQSVENVSYWSPDLLLFTCAAEGGESTLLIQHYTQLNFCVRVEEKKDPSLPPHQIGFRSPDGE